MPYRGDETDPLEIIISQRRAMRRAMLLMIGITLMHSLWRLDYVRPAPALMGAPASTTAAPITAAPGSEPVSTATPRRKLPAAEVERQLQRAIASAGRPEDPRCSPGLGGWDYVCSYRAGKSPTRVKIGVLVGAADIVHASVPYPIERSLPTAPVVSLP